MQLTKLVLLTSSIALAAGAAESSIFQIRLALDASTADSEQMKYKTKDGQTMTLHVQKTPLLDLTAVESAAVDNDTPTRELGIRITFTAQGRQRFAEVTKQIIHKRIAIVIDGKVYSAPIIQAEISADSVPITGDSTERQETQLAEKINAAIRSK